MSKLPPEKRLYPVFCYHSPGNEDDIQAYILPMQGKGLWGAIYGYIALETDMNTIKGISFGHESETPGLGARITTKEVQDRYIGKKIFDDAGTLVSVTMLKGERHPASQLDEHHIDGMSGATLTGKGVNQMLIDYLGYYQKFLNKNRSATNKTASL